MVLALLAAVTVTQTAKLVPLLLALLMQLMLLPAPIQPRPVRLQAAVRRYPHRSTVAPWKRPRPLTLPSRRSLSSTPCPPQSARLV